MRKSLYRCTSRMLKNEFFQHPANAIRLLAAVGLLWQSGAMGDHADGPTAQLNSRNYSYTGGAAIVFRMDDAEKGVREHIADRIIRIFYDNDVPLDVGIIPYAKGRRSYDIPFLKNYINKGIVDISMHGYAHLYREFDTSHRDIGYRALRLKLTTARKELAQYFGKAPLSLSVPYDVFDKDGYRAIRDAGFRIISSQWISEPNPSAIPVTYEGAPSKHGLYRIPAVDDVIQWDAKKREWGDILPMDYLRYAINVEIEKLGVAVLSIHPQSFDDNGRASEKKLAQLDGIVKKSKQIARVITFEDWFNYHYRRQHGGTFTNSFPGVD